MKHWKSFLLVFLSACLILSGCGASSSEKDALEAALSMNGSAIDRLTDFPVEPEYPPEEEPKPLPAREPAAWAIYWYLCGSDLESEDYAASFDLDEMMEVDLPENVEIVIQTGGARAWHTDGIPDDAIGRFLYDSDGFQALETLPQANMGERETLTDFLSFCRDNYPAEHTMVLFWNHGGGSVDGAAFDENYDWDSLDLEEFYHAFFDVYPLSDETPPIDVIGFDCCLMATIDVAYTFCDIGRYLVASEESEPGFGWEYTSWLQALADDPAMDGARLGTAICDAFYDGCEEWDVADDVTLSVTDLSKLDPLMHAYEQLGLEALSAAVEDPKFFSVFGRCARKSENYGGNTQEEGYSNLVDLGHLVRNCASLLPGSQDAVLDALNQCIVYQVKGPYRDEATGLSCYYSYNSDPYHLEFFNEFGASTSFKYLYEYAVYGELSEDGLAYITQCGLDSSHVKAVPTLDSMGADELPIYINDDSEAVLEISPEICELLTSVQFKLYYMDEAAEQFLLLGTDNDIASDWGSGIFKDNFRGVWGSIDGHLVYMEVTYESDDYTMYSIPILLNGERCNLRVSYDYNVEKYFILGARSSLNEHGAADKGLQQLKPGDKITAIHYYSDSFDEDTFEEAYADTFTVTEDTCFEEAWLYDGDYMLVFKLFDTQNNILSSSPAHFEIVGEDIYTYK